ncbi:glycerophosphoryl diester phosphodiesterase membrane domain-containing protein [Sphingobium sp. BYY-5]|uniref:glycerophosphoryl diester phosphodiesterase membrane domain-containing protein n=1 Tax=Sphingobium sp. BYY-5 TaxID=2926400 RepID=UPI001FA6B9BA|nr:glycerophosphoryl diester phosphodiesterase membrane domain-containing protein [Sphingobium sp. BYY-5]MCI4591600.1 glycerophosphoryl diester phosphodiesterase membrane domain-containing protein [Sphingobium sp. BYY-5]
MTTMSIGKAWEEAVAFVAREASLLFPVALLFVALPGVILQEMTPPELQAWFAQPKADAIPAMPPGFAVAMLLTILLIWFGSLALFALALRPGISVGEALRLSFARLPVLIGTALVVVGAIAGIFAVALLLGVIFSLASKQLAALLGLLLGVGAVGLVLYASIRLVLLNPVVIDGQTGVMDSLRRAWALTRGHFWRLFGFLLLVMLLSTIVASVAQMIVGLLGSLVAGADGARIAGGIAGAAVSSIIQVYMLVMLARLYRQAVAV